jgi:hypothetical protein
MSSKIVKITKKTSPCFYYYGQKTLKNSQKKKKKKKPPVVGEGVGGLGNRL